MEALKAMAAQREREQGLVGAQVLDAGDGERARFDGVRRLQVRADVAGHVLGGDQPCALHPPQQAEPGQLFRRRRLRGVGAARDGLRLLPRRAQSAGVHQRARRHGQAQFAFRRVLHATAGTAQQDVQLVGCAQAVVEERKRAPVGLADVVVQPAQVFVDAVQFAQAPQAAREALAAAPGVAAADMLAVPRQQRRAALAGLDLLRHRQDRAAPRQRVIALVQLGVVADEEVAHVALEPLARELRGGFGLAQLRHQIADLQAHRGQRHQQPTRLVGGLVQGVAGGLALRHLLQLVFDRAHLRRDEGGAMLGELDQQREELVHDRRHGDHFAGAHPFLPQPARATETVVDVVDPDRQWRVRGIAVLVFPGVIGEQIALQRRGDLAALETHAGWHRRVRPEELIEQPA